MKLLARLLLIGAFTYILSFYTPWWIVFVVAFTITFFIHGSDLNAFISGFLGVGIVWLAYAWYLDFKNESRFSGAMVELFPIEDQVFLIIASGIIGGLSGGLAGLAGNNFKKLFFKKKAQSLYS